MLISLTNEYSTLFHVKWLVGNVETLGTAMFTLYVLSRLG